MDISAIEARLEKISPPPWETDSNEPFSNEWQGIFAASIKGYVVKNDFDEQPKSADMEFIAHAPEDIAELIARVRKLETWIREHR